MRPITKLEPQERAAVGWSCVYFFFLLSSYYVLRPLRDAMGIAGNVKTLPWLFMGTLAGMLVAQPLFQALVSRWPRRRFIPIVYRFFALNLIFFFVLLRGSSLAANVTVARVFFIWTSVFNLFAVSVFWGFMADLYRPEQGKRLFGLIGVGGTLGAMAGAALTAALAKPLGPVNLILVAAALLELAVFAMRRVANVVALDVQHPQGLHKRGMLEAIGVVFASPYLLGICLYMLLYTFTSTFVYFEQARIIAASVKDDAARTALFARMDLCVNLLALVAQTLLTARLMRGLGVAATLALLPAFSLLGFAGLGVRPTLAVLVVFQVLRRAIDYAAARPAREVLFTVVEREDKYKAKSFIDTVVYRSGDAFAAWAFAFVAGGLVAPLVACAAWVGLSVYLGRREAVLSSRA